MLQYNKSLGSLYLSHKTKDRAPDMKGKLTIKRQHLEQMMNELAHQNSDSVAANIAAWSNTDSSGKKCLTIELQPQSSSIKKKEKLSEQARTIFDFIEEQNS